MRTLTRRAAALSIVAALTLAGCGGSDDDASTSPASETAPTVDPASGDVITADDFEFTAPDGWKDSKSTMPSALALAADLTDKDGFSDNVNVITDDTVVGVDLEKLEDAVEKVLEGVNATDIQLKERVEIDGEEAIRVGALFEQNGTAYRTDQYAVGHDDKGYVITFSFSESVSEADREALAESVLTTWKWSS